jgi:hypothetical protein
MKKSVIAIATVALLITSAFGATNECKQELKHLKRDFSNITDKGAECLAESMAIAMNNSLAKQSSAELQMHFSYANKTIKMEMSTHNKEKKITKEDQKMLLKQTCSNPLYKLFMQHGIKVNIEGKTAHQHFTLNITEKVCKKNHL